MMAVLKVASISSTLIKPEARRQIYWTKVSIHTFIQNGSTPASAAGIPNWREPFPPVQALADPSDANAAKATPLP
jgi:hypothetical protein